MVNLAVVAALHLSAALTCAAVQGSPAQRESVSLAFGNEPTGSANAAVASVIESARTPAKRLVIGFFMMSLLPLLLSPFFRRLTKAPPRGRGNHVPTSSPASSSALPVGISCALPPSAADL